MSSKSSRKTALIVGVAAAASVAAAAFAGAGGAISFPGFAQDAQLPLTKASTAPLFQPPPGAPLSFADIFERVSPAVVSIEVTSQVPRANTSLQQFGFPPGFPIDPEMLQPQPPGRGGRGGGATREARSSGSGFFISADGYLVTNHHVVENATDIKIVLKDKRELKATVVGTDQATDLAVIKVEGRNFPFVNFENSSTPRVGDWVITIGNPFGLGGTATAGIVSATVRNVPDDSASNFVDFLQIDAAINRGNSGGPTFDVYGRVIGVNSAIYSPSRDGGSVGIGFAIPADVADQITKQLINGGKITRGFLGASITPFIQEYADALGVEYPGYGAFVQGVTPEGPAQTAGLKEGDVVLTLNGQRVADATALTRMVAASRTGDTLRLEILREGRPRTITVRSGTRPTEAELLDRDNEPRGGRGGRGPRGGVEEAPARPITLGLTLAPLDEAIRRRFSIDERFNGVAVQAIEEDSPAAGRLRPGDVILQVRGQAATTPAQVAGAVEATRRAGRKTILFMILRAGQTAAVIVDLENDEDS